MGSLQHAPTVPDPPSGVTARAGAWMHGAGAPLPRRADVYAYGRSPISTIEQAQIVFKPMASARASSSSLSAPGLT